ncbi:cytochrome P450 [Corynebacterium maris DSM 45190]|uniref:Cytochrome P450 n=1 Tax=Corynebacterium maris DSM 45190 TaxID=1224163 RepID=S5T3Y5_9CORY|nr:cytochrome P450 [Corynebacterium maris]AGS35360.1 cytochrome P450 [Corynebacterium maris DSM 45190]
MTTATPTAIDAPVYEGDPFSMEALRDPHKFDGEVRELGPVVYIKKYDYYAITQFTELQKALRDWRRLSSADRPFYEDNPYRPKVLVLEDPPTHTISKNAVMSVLAGDNLVKFEEYFTAEAEKLVDELLADGPIEIDAFNDLAVRYVLKVFPDMLGLPEEGRELLLKFGDGVFNVFGPESEFQDQKLARAAEAQQWVEDNTWRTQQKEGSVGAQLYAMVDEGKLEEEHARQLLKSIFAAGFDTTTASIASMFRAFADNPDQWELLKENPDLLENAWEEAIRYYPASRYGGRVAKKEAVLGGVRIPEGSEILTMWLGAGRDPRQFEDPDSFRVDRDMSKGHLSFGFGIHTCAGNLVARLEARVLLRAVLERVERIELAGEPRQAVNYQAFGHEYVPVRLIPRD